MTASIDLLTERLRLRAARPGDAAPLFANYCGDPACCQFLQRKPHADVRQTDAMLARWSDPAEIDLDGSWMWVIALRESDEPVGVFVVIRDGHKAEIHYGIAKTLWGQGLVAEAGQAAMTMLQQRPGLERIWTVCDVDNHGSRRILEKLGFQQEGILHKWLKLPAYDNAARDCLVFAALGST